MQIPRRPRQTRSFDLALTRHKDFRDLDGAYCDWERRWRSSQLEQNVHWRAVRQAQSSLVQHGIKHARTRASPRPINQSIYC